MKKTGDYKIPFRNGNQLDYEYFCTNPGIEWLDNFEFEDELTFKHYGRGRSSVTFTLERTNGKTVSMFVSDFSDAVPKLVDGKLKGRFTFVKKGTNYGCRMVF
jgi:hypothetical protein